MTNKSCLTNERKKSGKKRQQHFNKSFSQRETEKK